MTIQGVEIRLDQVVPFQCARNEKLAEPASWVPVAQQSDVAGQETEFSTSPDP